MGGRAALGIDFLDRRMVDGEFQAQIVRVIDIERNAITVIGNPYGIVCGLEPLLDALLGLGVAFEGDMAGRGEFDRVFVLVRPLEKCEGATIADFKKRMTVFAARRGRLLGPGREQRQAQNILVELARGLLVARYPGGVVQAARSRDLGANG